MTSDRIAFLNYYHIITSENNSISCITVDLRRVSNLENRHQSS